MSLTLRGCLFPYPNGMETHLCTIETCILLPIYSTISASCPSHSEMTTTNTLSDTAHSQLVSSRCMVNRTTEFFAWHPSIDNCISAQENETTHFYGSLYVLRQLAQAFEAGRVAAVSVREKPLVSLSVGMSALSVILVLIMLMGVCNRQQQNSSANQRQRQLTAAAARNRRRAERRNRRRGEDDQHHSIGTQAEPPSTFYPNPSELEAQPSVEVAITPRASPIEVGLNEGFLDHEALINRTSSCDENVECLSASLSLLPRSTEMSSSTEPSRNIAPEMMETLHSMEGATSTSIPSQANDSGHKVVFKGTPWLPSYFDANKTGMYCIVQESTTPPPDYDKATGNNNSNDCNQTSGFAGNLTHPTLWDFEVYGVHRGTTNSMPEISNLFDPPPSPYPEDANRAT